MDTARGDGSMRMLGRDGSARVLDSGTRRPRAIRVTLLLGFGLTAILASHDGSARAEEPAPRPSGAAVPRVPMLSTQGPVTKVEGKITRSSRGRKGPVRLLVERASGGPVTILVAADEYCDRVGLSLRAGETIAAEGTMVKGERPILLASSVTVDGKTVQIRDAAGKLVEAGGAAAAPAGAATMGGGKPPTDGAKPATGASQR